MRFLSVAFLILLIIIIINLVNKKSCEGFDNSENYNSQTPSAMFFPGTCRCDNGSIGYYLPGFGGKCMCGYYN
jgi:hypothetical protein